MQHSGRRFRDSCNVIFLTTSATLPPPWMVQITLSGHENDIASSRNLTTGISTTRRPYLIHESDSLDYLGNPPSPPWTLDCFKASWEWVFSSWNLIMEFQQLSGRLLHLCDITLLKAWTTLPSHWMKQVIPSHSKEWRPLHKAYAPS